MELATSFGIASETTEAHMERHLAVAEGFANAFEAAGVRPITVRRMSTQVNANVERLR